MSIIMCHYFHDNKKYKKVQGSIDINKVEKIFLDVKYNVISVDKYMRKLESGQLKENEICFTFDDGLKEQYELAYRLLKKYNVRGLFNINTLPLVGEVDKLELYRYYRNYCCKNLEDFYEKFFNQVKIFLKSKYEEICLNLDFNKYLEKSKFYTYSDRKFRYFRDEILKENYINIMDILIKNEINIKYDNLNLWMNEQELKELSREGHLIGLHTHSHPTNLDKLTYEIQKNEFKKNKEILEAITKKQVEIVAYPCGKYNDETFKIMKELKIKYGLAATTFEKLENRLLLKRIDIADFIKEYE